VKMSIRRRDDWHCRGQIGLAEAPLAASGADRTRRRCRVPGLGLATIEQLALVALHEGVANG
jgi:hypothetical protein